MFNEDDKLLEVVHGAIYSVIINPCTLQCHVDDRKVGHAGGVRSSSIRPWIRVAAKQIADAWIITESSRLTMLYYLCRVLPVACLANDITKRET